MTYSLFRAYIGYNESKRRHSRLMCSEHTSPAKGETTTLRNHEHKVLVWHYDGIIVPSFIVLHKTISAYAGDSGTDRSPLCALFYLAFDFIADNSGKERSQYGQ